ncbi:MFS transporter [Streptococcus didelphis]|uniref:MFS transporter n=1 Tax=Streptococcus didelphis TaxID=102886 RepID=A0ABY9LIH3_9STRE|nr:MFS transporter [Streptococcus didelphis]WMB27960.1 MFS transporter [Streptococcus didelphis]WMB29572.1 MFS transporter [Streptococcus didelphis]
MIGAVFIGLSNNGDLGQFPPFLQELHGPVAAATIISIYSAVGIFGKIIIGTISDKLGTLNGNFFASVICILAYILAMFANHYPSALLMGILFGLGNGIGTIGEPLITASLVSPENYQKFIPIYNPLFN